MRISIKLIAAAPLLLVTGVALSAPAAATDLAEALKLCAKNPDCSAGVMKHGSRVLVIKQSDGTQSTVDCPPKGPCYIVAAKGSSGRGKPGGTAGAGAVGNVMGVSSPTKETGKTGAGVSAVKGMGVRPPASSPKEPKRMTTRHNRGV
jgi:hypothetical protein